MVENNELREQIVKILDRAKAKNEIQGVTVLKIVALLKKQKLNDGINSLM